MSERHVICLINEKLNVYIHPSDISACHAIRNGTKSRKPGRDNIMHNLSIERRYKYSKKAKLLKGTNIFIKKH